MHSYILAFLLVSAFPVFEESILLDDPPFVPAVPAFFAVSTVVVVVVLVLEESVVPPVLAELLQEENATVAAIANAKALNEFFILFLV